jgi:hypothetical protein
MFGQLCRSALRREKTLQPVGEALDKGDNEPRIVSTDGDQIEI